MYAHNESGKFKKKVDNGGEKKQENRLKDNGMAEIVPDIRDRKLTKKQAFQVNF